MKPQESHISVALVEDLAFYPQEVWDLGLTQLDMLTEEIVAEFDAITWAGGSEYPDHSAISAKLGRLEWGASGSFGEFALDVATGSAGGVGAVATVAAIKAMFEKLKGRSQRESWDDVPTEDRAILLTKSRIHRHYGVAEDKLTVVRSDVDTLASRYDLEFLHEDGRKFGATVGAIAGIATCTRIWSEGGDPFPRPTLEAPSGES